MLECIAVGVGGFIGSICRYLIGLIPLKEGYVFPVKTFVINLCGSFLIGMIAALAAKHDSLNPKLILFLKAGVCGGFTTFSSFALETGEYCNCSSVCRSEYGDWRACCIRRTGNHSIKIIQENTMEDILRVGVITTTHGLRGEVKVFPTTDDPKRFKKLKEVLLDTGKERRKLQVESVRV